MDIQGDQIEGESCVTHSIIDELHSSDIQGDEIESESGVTLSNIDKFHSWDIRGDQMEGESGVIRNKIDKLILGISEEIKWKLQGLVLEVPLMKFILGI